MSDEKRQQLIAEGKLNADGSRKVQCPTCHTEVGQVLTQEAYDAVVAEAAAPEAVAVTTEE